MEFFLEILGNLGVYVPKTRDMTLFLINVLKVWTFFPCGHLDFTNGNDTPDSLLYNTTLL